MTYLGPTRTATRGTSVTSTATNSLGAHPLASVIDPTISEHVEASDGTNPRVSLHLHGGYTAPQHDGEPTATFKSGESHVFSYASDQEAATLWYHDHAMGITRLNVMAGLAGFYLLRDAYDTGAPGNGLGLPAGAYEVPLVIQDRAFNPDGSLFYPAAGLAGTYGGDFPNEPPPIWIPEFFGDVAVVNSIAWPYLAVDRGLYRLRFLNGSNARFYNLRLSNQPAPPMWQIGTDGGLLNRPVPIGQLLLGPGERADVLIDFSGLQPGTRVTLTNNAVTPFPNGPRPIRKGGQPIKEIMQFVVGPNTGFTGPVPTTLRGGTDQPPLIQPLSAPAALRNMVLVEVLDPVSGLPIQALLNNRRFDDPGGVISIGVNTVEDWNIVNTTGDSHTIHLHLVQAQLLNRQKLDAAAYLAALNAAITNCAGLPDPCAAGLGDGTGANGAPDPTPFLQGAPRAPKAEESGWKDTIRMDPGQVTRIRVPFGGGVAGAPYGGAFTTSASQYYVWHCHLLEHEDNEMMLKYQVA